MSGEQATGAPAVQGRPVSGAPGWGVSSADCAHPRVWLVGRFGTAPEPTDQPAVRDDLMRTWRPGPDGRYTTGGGRHHATWGELRVRHDLVEVAEARMAEVIRWGTP